MDALTISVLKIFIYRRFVTEMPWNPPFIPERRCMEIGLNIYFRVAPCPGLLIFSPLRGCWSTPCPLKGVFCFEEEILTISVMRFHILRRSVTDPDNNRDLRKRHSIHELRCIKICISMKIREAPYPWLPRFRSAAAECSWKGKR